MTMMGKSEVTIVPQHSQKQFYDNADKVQEFQFEQLERYYYTRTSQVIEFNVPFPWVIYSLHFAHGNVSESTFTMNVFRF